MYCPSGTIVVPPTIVVVDRVGSPAIAKVPATELVVSITKLSTTGMGASSFAEKLVLVNTIGPPTDNEAPLALFMLVAFMSENGYADVPTVWDVELYAGTIFPE
jgi:hypothetical protein